MADQSSTFEQLDELGFATLPDLVPAELLSAVREQVDRLLAEEGAAAGSEFKQEHGSRRLANLVGKGEVFWRAVLYRPVLDAVAHVLGPEFKLSSLNARVAEPHNGVRQPLHADMGARPDARGNWVCNAIWMLDEFTLENGPTRAVPGTHRALDLPQDALASAELAHPDEVLLTGPAGAVVVMNAHLWHGGLENKTGTPRRALHVFFARRDKPQQQYQRMLLSESVQRQVPIRLRELLALDDPLNDQLSAEVNVRSGFLK